MNLSWNTRPLYGKNEKMLRCQVQPSAHLYYFKDEINEPNCYSCPQEHGGANCQSLKSFIIIINTTVLKDALVLAYKYF